MIRKGLAKMFKCPLCASEYEKWRSLHGHMLKSHTAEYKAKGCKLSAYGIVINAGADSKPTKKEPPEDFRALDLSDPDEKEAYDEGFRYYTNGNACTSAECKEMGWI